jgi:hypothetical protein
MSKLEQKYSWSESRINMLKECAYKYYLNYYASWEGWMANADELKRQAYIIKNMSNVPMFVGSIVHNNFERIIGIFRNTGVWENENELIEKCKEDFRIGWKQSKQQLWKKDPKKNTNLYEHFYNEEIDVKSIKEVPIKIATMVKQFYSSELFKIMSSLKKEDWLTIEELQEFSLKGGENVFVKIDCGFRKDGIVYLLDWKTGKITDKALQQLTAYAMYAIKKGWTDDYRNIRLVPVYLMFCNENNGIQFIKVTMDDILTKSKKIVEDSVLLKDAHVNKDKPASFEYTSNKWMCKRCSFRTMCPGANRA